MTAPESVGPDTRSGLFSSLRSFWSVLIAILHTRLDLATTELEEEIARTVRLIVVTLAAVLCVSMTIFFLSLFIIVYYWATHRLLVVGIVLVAYFLASILLMLAARYMFLNRPKFLSQTLMELHRDVEGLRTNVKPPMETKP